MNFYSHTVSTILGLVLWMKGVASDIELKSEIELVIRSLQLDLVDADENDHPLITVKYFHQLSPIIPENIPVELLPFLDPDRLPRVWVVWVRKEKIHRVVNLRMKAVSVHRRGDGSSGVPVLLTDLSDVSIRRSVPPDLPE